tara:strand:- start:2837 stop:4747 length:1911 start_codon:yes stop_codon:yes gene_type:complete
MALTKVTSGVIKSDINLDTNNINATGVITATAFSGDGANLTGLPAGLGTALSIDQTNPLNKVYFTDEILSIGSNVTVNVPNSSTGAYTQYSDIVVEQGVDLTVSEGDLVPDILGLSTSSAAVPLSGAGGRVRADSFTDKTGTGAPLFPNGAVVTGVITATTFSGIATAATKVYVDESEDDGVAYNIIFTDENPDGGNKYHTLQVDDGGLTFNPGDNILKVSKARIDTFIYNDQDPNNLNFGFSGDTDFRVETGGKERLRIGAAGISTFSSQITVGNSFIKDSAVGVGTTTVVGRDAGIGTAVGTINYIPTIGLQVYSGDVAGWKTISGTSNAASASGGDINAAPAGGKLYHVFTSSGTLTTTGSIPQVSILVVAGGGGGGAYPGNGGGGGGAGGVAVYPNFTLGTGSYAVTVGGGGAGATSAPQVGTKGADSSFGSSPQPAYILAAGGGGGTASPSNPGADGGSGGGGSAPSWPIGTGTQPTLNAGNPNIVNYGNPGGTGDTGPGGVGGGGGAGGVGGTGSGVQSPASKSGPGGAGQPLPAFAGDIAAFSPMPADWISAVGPTGLYGGGGGGGSTAGTPPPSGGPGGGGTGGGGPGVGGQTPGVANTGGGGGAAGFGTPLPAGSGADGIVIVFYPE